MRKIQIYKIMFLVCFWILASVFIAFYDASVAGFRSAIGGEHYSFLRVLISGILSCFFGGTLLGSLEVL